MAILYLNTLKIESENETILNDFIDFVNAPEAETALSFNKLISCPDGLQSIKGLTPKQQTENILKYGVPSKERWYEEHWGPNEDVHADIFRINKQAVHYLFYTGFQPPVEWVKFTATQYPEIKFTLEYYEADGSFVIEFVAVGEKHELVKQHIDPKIIEKLCMV